MESGEKARIAKWLGLHTVAGDVYKAGSRTYINVLGSHYEWNPRTDIHPWIGFTATDGGIIMAIKDRLGARGVSALMHYLSEVQGVEYDDSHYYDWRNVLRQADPSDLTDALLRLINGEEKLGILLGLGGNL